jgi:hypothetical protein
LVVAFAAGAVVGALLAALLMRPAQRARAGGVWRERAERSERELILAKRHLETLGTELRQLTERFNTLTTRFEAMQSATPAPTP